jgi:uncharacterized membrane protein
MAESIFKWVRKLYNKFLHSVGFIPAIMGIGFLLLAIATIELDSSAAGLKLTKQFKWLTLKDAATARTIVGTIAAGIISLTVFSFSMVMIVMSQAASQMSNRMLDNIIGDRVQKCILGFYIGTIVFSLFLSTNISETGNDINVPSLSVHFLLVLTMIDIFLFIYFLHHITQSFRYEQLIQRIHNRTTNTLIKLTKDKQASIDSNSLEDGQQILSDQSGYYQGFDEKRLLKFAVDNDVVLEFLLPIGSYVLKGVPLFKVSTSIKEELLSKLLLDIDFYYGQEIDKNAYYGYFHLTEVAIKALSPGINDPGTAVLSINALADLLAQIIQHPIENVIKDAEGKTRIITKQLAFEELYESAVLPIWDYGKNDRMVQNGFKRMLQQLMEVTEGARYTRFFQSQLEVVNNEPVK